MGAAASARYEPEILMELVVQQEKPIDASDVSDLDIRFLVILMSIYVLTNYYWNDAD